MSLLLQGWQRIALPNALATNVALLLIAVSAYCISVAALFD